jgi:hypothetical protein
MAWVVVSRGGAAGIGVSRGPAQRLNCPAMSNSRSSLSDAKVRQQQAANPEVEPATLVFGHEGICRLLNLIMPEAVTIFGRSDTVR